MQLLARLMDRVLAARGERVTIVGATSGDTGGAAIEAFRGSSASTPSSCSRSGRVSDVQRRMMTTARRAQRARRRDRRHVRRLPGAGEGACSTTWPSATASGSPASTPSTGRAWWRRSPTTSSAAAALGAPHRAVSFSVPTGNFGDIFAGYAAKRMGLPIERLVIATNDNDILRARACHRRLRGARRGGHHLAVDGHPGLLQLRALPVRGARAAMRPACAARWARSTQSRPLRARATALEPMRARLRRRAPTRPRSPTASAASRPRSGYLLDPHTACGVVAAPRRHDSRPSTSPHVVLATAHPAKFPDAMQAITGERPALPPRLASLMTDPERITVLPNDLAAVAALRRRSRAARKRRSRRMSTQLTRAAERPARRLPPHAASGDGVAGHLGRRRRAPRAGRASTASRTCWSTWPSRAPSGAAPATSPRRSRRSAASSMPPPAWRPPPITRACSRPMSASRSTSWPTSCRSRATPRTSWSASAR